VRCGNLYQRQGDFLAHRLTATRTTWRGVQSAVADSRRAIAKATASQWAEAWAITSTATIPNVIGFTRCLMQKKWEGKLDSVSPVLTEAETESEQVVALEQEQYYPIIVARILFQDQTPCSMVRFRFTDRERKLIVQGADLIIGQPHHGSMMPMSTQLAMPGEYPKT